MITSKKCGGCGFDNDTLLTNCICCKKPLPSVNPDEISSQTLIMEGSKWVGYTAERFIQLEGGSFWLPILLLNGQMVGIAKQYINMLKVRGYSNEIAQNVSFELQKDLDNNIKEASKKQTVIDNHLKHYLIFCLIIILIPIILIYLK